MRIFLSFFILIILSVLIIKPVTAKPVPVEYYSRLPAIYDAAISPDGNWLATIVNYNGEYVLKVYNLANPSDKKKRGTTYPSSVKVNWVRWANNEQILLSTRQSEKSKGTVYYSGYLFAIDRDVTKSRMVLKPDVGKAGSGVRLGGVGMFRQFNNTVVDFLPNEPNHIIMAFGAEDPYAIGAHKVNINNRSKTSLNRGSTDIQYWLTDRRGEVRIGQGRKEGSGDWRMTIKDGASNKWRGAEYYPGLEAGSAVYGFTSDQRELIVGSYNGKDTFGLYVYNLAHKKQTRKLFHNNKYDVEDIIVSPDGKSIVGATYLANTIKREYFDAGYKDRIATIERQLPGYQIHLIEETPDGRIALFKAEAASVAPALYLYNFEEKRGDFLARDYPEIGETIQGDVTDVSYTARDQFKIPGYITTPPKIGSGEVEFKNLPFIIMPHGGPYARDTSSFDYLAQFMASRGYAVLQMNFRGSEGYGSAHEEAGRKNWEIMQQDVEDGTRWLIKKGYADPERICIVGWSYGGYAALMGAITDPDLYTCSASIAGVTDLKDMINDIKKYRFGKHAVKSFIIKGFKDKDDIKANSPVKRANEITTPIFMAHGTDDVNVHIDQFTRMKSALKKSKAKTTFMKFKDEDHYFIDFENRSKMMRGLDKFLRDNLGESEAAP